jgi:ATP-dependent RNA helicase DDX52/ROK1
MITQSSPPCAHISHNRINPPILIFTSSQPRASSLAEELVLNGIPNVDCLHAGMTMKERDDAVSRMRRGESWVMISTEVMARGMDFKGVREVINYDFPRSVQSYVHRIGKLAFIIVLCTQIYLTLSRSYRSSGPGREGSDLFHRRRCTISEVVSRYLSSPYDPTLMARARIANVLLQSGSPVPEWIPKLPKPSKLKRKQMGKVKRAEAVNPARRIGRSDAIKKR